MTGARPASDIPGVTRHAQDRLLDHFGVVATPAEWHAAVLAICDRTALLVRRSSDPATGRVHNEVYSVRIGDLDGIQVAWSPGSGSVTTVLPPSSRSRRARAFQGTRARDSREDARDRAEALLDRLHQGGGE